MNKKPIVGIGLLLAVAACSSDGSTPKAGSSHHADAGGAAAVNAASGTSAVTPAGSGGSTAHTSGGAGGGLVGGIAGGGTSGQGVSAGTGGGSMAGTAGHSIGGSGGAPSPGTSGQSSSGASGGVSSGGASPSGGGAGSPAGGNAGAVTVQLAQPKQTMDGFGINDPFLDNKAYSDTQADAMFDPVKGIGLSILRIGMGTDGDQISNNCWSDVKKASARGANTVIASVWSAPANDKSNNSVNDGGHLNTSAYDSWASTIAAFPAKVKQNTGVDLYAMSPSNEPEFASCGKMKPCNGNYATMLFTADEMVNFVNAVGPKLKAASPNVKLMTPDTSEWIHLWTNMSAPGSTDPLKGMGYDYGHALFKDSTAWGLLDIIGTHQYDTQVAEPWPSDVPQTKPVWMTEMSGVLWWPEDGPTSDIDNGVVVAGWIHDAIVNGPASAWLWWWYQAQGTDDNEGLLLQDGTVAKRFYTLGNYSRFIRPGYTRVDVTGNVPADVLLTAYKGSDGTVVVVAINQGSTPVSMPISIAGGTAPASLTPNVTSALDDLAAQPAVPVSGGAFTAALDSQTVTTFVGK